MKHKKSVVIIQIIHEVILNVQFRYCDLCKHPGVKITNYVRSCNDIFDILSQMANKDWMVQALQVWWLVKTKFHIWIIGIQQT